MESVVRDEIKSLCDNYLPYIFHESEQFICVIVSGKWNVEGCPIIALLLGKKTSEHDYWTRNFNAIAEKWHKAREEQVDDNQNP